MKKYLITGFSGFVSKHFIDYLEASNIKACILGIDINKPEFDYAQYQNISCAFEEINLLDKNELNDIISKFQPHFILHLASFSSVAFSWKNPVSSFSNNTNIFLNLLESVRTLGIKCRILSVGSSEEYGNVSEADIPLEETSPLKPLSPYAVARVSQEMLSKIYVDGYGLDIVLTRSFNHIGPGQKEVFVISSFVKRIVEIKKHKLDPVLETGDLSIIRDFLDVRDVVSAYDLLFQRGRSGEIYNICSGQGIKIGEILVLIGRLANIEIATVPNLSLIRPNDNRIIIGSNLKIRRELEWEIKYNLEQSLRDIINFWEKRI